MSVDKRFVITVIVDVPEDSKLKSPGTTAWVAKAALRQLGFNIVSIDVEGSGVVDGNWTEIAQTG